MIKVVRYLNEINAMQLTLYNCCLQLMQLLHASYCYKLSKHAFEKATTFFMLDQTVVVSCRVRKLHLTVVSNLSCTVYVSLKEANSVTVGEGHSTKDPYPPPRRKLTILPSPSLDILYKFKTFVRQFPTPISGRRKFPLWVGYGPFLEMTQSVLWQIILLYKLPFYSSMKSAIP